MSNSAARDTRLTVDDFVLFPDDGRRHEIIDGVHYVTPSPVTRHQAISGRLFLSLGNYLEAHPQMGRAFFAPFDVIFTRWDVAEPDLLVIAGDQLDILTDKNVQGGRPLSWRSSGLAPARSMSRSSSGCSIAAAFANNG